MAKKAGRTTNDDIMQKYSKMEFEEDSDRDPYKRFFAMVQDHFEHNIHLPKYIYYNIALRSLRGSLRLVTKEDKKE